MLMTLLSGELCTICLHHFTCCWIWWKSSSLRTAVSF